jgi:hypothetical protein
VNRSNMPRNKSDAAHIRRPGSAYGWCGAPALGASGTQAICLECAIRHATYVPQPSIMHVSGAARPCRDYQEAANA